MEATPEEAQTAAAAMVEVATAAVRQAAGLAAGSIWARKWVQTSD